MEQIQMFLLVVKAGAFRPQNTDLLFPSADKFPFPSSHHRLVWIDITGYFQS
jgi:hypothetical protein